MTLTAARIELPKMLPLPEANAALGDHAALDALWEQNGFLFFRDVLDRDAVRETRQAFVDVLVRMGVVDEGAEEPVWNGADLANFPVKIEALHEIKVWERFVAQPLVHDFFKRFFGDIEPVWVPIVEYRVTPPATSMPDDPLAGRHQDGFYNGDLDCRTCWIPLIDIDDTTGGIAMATGMHRQGYLHDAKSPPQYSIPQGAIPPDVWRRSHYHPGDLLMFNRWIPHSGLPNMSNRFRLSMDIRVMPATAELPVWGEVLAFDPGSIKVRNHDGRTVRLKIDGDTYCRWTSGRRIPVEELIAQIPPGDSVLAFCSGDRATMLRPPR